MLRNLSIAAALALLLTAPAYAGDAPGILSGGENKPNFVGSTGLLLTPDAETVGNRGVSVFGSANSRFNSFGAILGITDRFEIGLTFFDLDDDCGCLEDGFGLNAKFKAIKESTFIPGFAVGVVDVFDELDVDPSWYVVASKDIGKMIPLRPFDLKASVGFGGGIYRNEPFAALEIGIATPLDAIPVTHPRVSFIPEVRDGEVNLGLRAKWRGFGATVALFDMSRVGGMVSYTTGLRL